MRLTLFAAVPLLAAGLALVSRVAIGQAPDADVQSYLRAASTDRVGTVQGRVYQERRRPDGRDEPLGGTVVVLVPSSKDLLDRLEAVKRHARDSDRRYRAAADSVRRLREAYEAELWRRGGAELVLGTTVGPDGTFRLTDVPAGPWVLFATRRVLVEKPSAEPPKRERAIFAPRTRLTGFSAVTLWLRDLTVSARGVTSVELTDRGQWMEGVEEERSAGP